MMNRKIYVILGISLLVNLLFLVYIIWGNQSQKINENGTLISQKEQIQNVSTGDVFPFETVNIDPDSRSYTGEDGTLRDARGGLIDTKPYFKMVFDEMTGMNDTIEQFVVNKTPAEIIQSKGFKDLSDNIQKLAAKYKDDPIKYTYIKDQYFADLLTKLNNHHKINLDKYDLEYIALSQARQNFTTIEQKKKMTKDYTDSVVNPNIANIINSISKYDMKKVLADDDQFKKVFLDPSDGIIYSMMHVLYNWEKIGIGYISPSMKKEFVDFLYGQIDIIFAKAGTNFDEVRGKTFKIMGRTGVDSINADIVKYSDDLIKKYGFSDKMGMPTTRAYSYEERRDIFNTQQDFDRYLDKISGGKKDELIKDLQGLRIRSYLFSLFQYSKDKNFDETAWRSPYRISLFGKGVLNMYRLSRYVSPEVPVPGGE